jgi:hypothetical protein
MALYSCVEDAYDEDEKIRKTPPRPGISSIVCYE